MKKPTHHRYHHRALLAAILTFSAVASADTITVRSDYWFPYNGEPGSAQEGYMIELLRLAAAGTGDTIDYRLMDWELALERSLNGTSDCVVGAIASDAPEHLRTSAAWGKSQNVVYGLDGNSITLNAVDDLKPLRIGVVQDYAYGDAIDALLEADGVQTSRVEASRRAFPLLVMKLVTRKIDVLIEDENVASAGLKELGLSDRVVPVSSHLTEADDLFVACTPNARGGKLIAAFDQILEQSRASGELGKILARYGLEDWAPVTP
jgi:polar amino acid transport system substrate-binding protein